MSVFNVSAYFKILSGGNDKTGKDMLVLYLPTSICHIKTETCLNCYAKNVENRYKKVIERWNKVYNFYKNDPDLFFNNLEKEVVESKYKIIRLFGSGDFPDLEFAEKIYNLCKKLNNKIFFGYTRMWVVDSYLKFIEKLNELDNTTIFCSIDRTNYLFANKIKNFIPTCYVKIDENDNEFKHVDNLSLIFKNYRLRYKEKLTYEIGKNNNRVLVCPMENGLKIAKSCLQCKFCFKTIKKRKNK